MVVAPGNGTADGDYGQFRASHTDRERAVDVLKAAFAEGRLTQDELDARVGQVYAARTYAELGALTGDVPAGPLGNVPAAGLRPGYLPVNRPTNSMAVASLACGIGAWFTGGLTAIPAVVCGHVARRQIRRTGEPGAGLATVGLTLGWIGVALWTLAVIAIVIWAAATHG